LIIVSVLVMAGILLSACGQSASDTIKVATDATFPPFEIVDEATNELTGFDVELMKAIAAGINL
jgi:polar amino acid transport system substrate-binding protein